MRSSLLSFGSLLWAGLAVATPCKPATPVSSSVSSSSAAPSASPSIVCTDAEVFNPTFYSGLNGWTTLPYSDGSFFVQASTDCGADALGTTVASCAQLYSHAGQQGSSSDASVYQAGIAVVAGASYTLYYDYRVTAAGSGIMGAWVDGTIHTVSAPNVQTGWMTYSVAFTASGSTVSVAPFQRSFGNSMTLQVTNVRVECSNSGHGSVVPIP